MHGCSNTLQSSLPLCWFDQPEDLMAHFHDASRLSPLAWPLVINFMFVGIISLFVNKWLQSFEEKKCCLLYSDRKKCKSLFLLHSNIRNDDQEVSKTNFPKKKTKISCWCYTLGEGSASRQMTLDGIPLMLAMTFLHKLTARMRLRVWQCPHLVKLWPACVKMSFKT